MQSPSIYVNSRGGFTLLEILIVMTLVSIISAVSLVMSFDDYRNNQFHANRDGLIFALQKTRSQAMNTICFGESCSSGKPHGVHRGHNSYTIFQGSSYASRDSQFDENTLLEGTLHLIGILDAIFEPLSGRVFTAGDVTISDSSGQSSAISINREGQITWTN